MIKRQLEKLLVEYSNKWPVVAVVGARQTGKTTLVKRVFPDYKYFNLEDPNEYQEVVSLLKNFDNNFSDGVFFDEIQRMPELLSYIQASVDRTGKMGKIIISGSENLLLASNISQSLAGRAIYLNMLPTSIQERMDSGFFDAELIQNIYKGGYPAIYNRELDATSYYEAYVQTYLQRDIQELSEVGDLTSFRRFLILLADNIGSPLSINNISKDSGLDRRKIEKWISILEATYVIFRLPAYFDKLAKRVIKAPKLYFYDTGLMSFLLGFKNAEDLMGSDKLGALFENFNILEIYKNYKNSGLTNEFFFWQQDKKEIDLLISGRPNQKIIDFKLSSKYKDQFREGFIKYQSHASSEFDVTSQFIVYSGDTDESHNPGLINWNDTDLIL
ncbi:MAG: ATP-binding protein [Lactobacillaceae bacterium]|jgi:predicted AAA+ superfamily ATPase|nr:ATP-binding protein [Lactobacillaceae bacterium]